MFLDGGGPLHPVALPLRLGEVNILALSGQATVLLPDPSAASTQGARGQRRRTRAGPRAIIEFGGDIIEVTLGNRLEVGSAREVLAQQARSCSRCCPVARGCAGRRSR